MKALKRTAHFIVFLMVATPLMLLTWAFEDLLNPPVIMAIGWISFQMAHTVADQMVGV